MTPQLTIAIPTFNRAKFLRRLLDALADDLQGLEDRVEVIVSDNASTDETGEVCAFFRARYAAARIIRNATNIGADGNVGQCFEAACGDHVWIIGDDDIPKRGAVGQLLALVYAEKPDLILCDSEWVREALSPDQGEPVGTLRFERLDREDFVRRTYVWLTFLSGVIVNKRRFMSNFGAAEAGRYRGTSFGHLAWILNLIISGDRLLHVRDKCVLATSGNSGGYAVLTAFGANLPRIAREIFGRRSALYRVLVGRTIATYLPQLIWNIRFGEIGAFSGEKPWPALRRELGAFPVFWLILLPLGTLPRPLAAAFFQLARIAARLWRVLDAVNDARLGRKLVSSRVG